MKKKTFSKLISIMLLFVFTCVVMNFGGERVKARTCSKARSCTCWCIDGNDIHSYGATADSTGCNSVCSARCSSIGDTLDRAELDSCGSNTATSTTCSYTTTSTSCQTGYTMTCNSGEYSDAGVCKSCVSGYWCDGTSFHACEGGKTSPAGASSSSQCTCPAGKYLSNNTCVTCPSGYTSNAGAVGDTQCYKVCAANTYMQIATASACTACPEGTSSSSHTVYYRNTSTCSSSTDTKPKAVITCSNKVYNGSAQTIASCSGGTISNPEGYGAGKAKAIGNYTFQCTGDSTHSNADSKVCSITSNSTTPTCEGDYSAVAADNGNDTECKITCPAGQHVATENGGCVACTGNTYSNINTVVYGGTSNCLACTGTKACANSDHTACVTCSSDPSDIGGGDDIDVTGVTVSPKTSEVKAGGTVQLTATITPSDATVTTVTWTSSDNTIATVDSNGKVTGIKEGTVTITVKTTDGGKTDTATVTVKPSTAVNVIFDCNGGSGTMQNMVVEYGQTVTLNENKCTRSGFTFKEWKGYIGTTEIQDGIFSDKGSFTNTYTEDVTLKAIWNSTSNAYLIHYNANGGSGSMADTTATNDTTGTLRKNTFKYSGHTFDGWKAYYIGSDGKLTALKDSNGKEMEFKNQATFKNLYGPNREEVTLYAQWKVVNPKTGIFTPTAIIGGLLLVSAFGYYLVKRKNVVLE